MGKVPEEVIRFFMRAREELGCFRIKALDIGCGMGACSWFMAKEGAIVTALDGAPSGIKNVNKLAKEFCIETEIENQQYLDSALPKFRFYNKIFNQFQKIVLFPHRKLQ